MGFIKLAAPVSHVWYLKGIPSYVAILLDMPLRDVEQIVYFNCYVVLDPGDHKDLTYKQLLTEDEWLEIEDQIYAEDSDIENEPIVGIGAEALKQLLEDLELNETAEQLREEIAASKGQKRAKLIKRLRVIDNFIATNARPTWMVLDVIPVIPPDLRPMVQLDGGRFATSDLNDLYRRVINRNNRLARLQEILAPEIIVRNEKRMLQEAVDALIDNGRRGRTVVSMPADTEALRRKLRCWGYAFIYAKLRHPNRPSLKTASQEVISEYCESRCGACRRRTKRGSWWPADNGARACTTTSRSGRRWPS